MSDTYRVLIALNRMEIRLMAALDDLKVAMTNLVNEAVADLEVVIAKLATTLPADTAALQALTQQAQDAVAHLKADMAALVATPPPTPSP